MARYNDAVCRLCRREGTKLFLKGDRCFTPKCGVERRGYPPGQHGQGRARFSDFGVQLREKQKVRRMYGLLEKQFARTMDRALHMKGRTGENLLVLLERRLDNVVYRLGFASTRAQARQFVNHGHVYVDGKRVDIASYSVKPGQEIAIGASSPVRPAAAASTELTGTVAPWLQTDFEALTGKILRVPERAEISAPIDEHLIVELYSRL